MDGSSLAITPTRRWPGGPADPIPKARARGRASWGGLLRELLEEAEQAAVVVLDREAGAHLGQRFLAVAPAHRLLRLLEARGHGHVGLDVLDERLRLAVAGIAGQHGLGLGHRGRVAASLVEVARA